MPKARMPRLSLSTQVLIGLLLSIACGLVLGDLATWVGLKRRDHTLDRLYRHWILGQTARAKHRRWSVVRDVLHWVD